MQELKKLIQQYIVQEDLPASYLDLALEWFTPLAESIFMHHNESKAVGKKTYFVGINGCQGSGKSTLSALLCFLLNEYYKTKTVLLSLDDFYLTKSEREVLAATKHPLLKTRGVPGTHDTKLMETVFLNLSSGKEIDIPRFDKSIDDRASKDKWLFVREPVDIVIMEGWCWGTPPQSPTAIEHPINEFEKINDSDSHWRNYVNTTLETQYMPLYSFMDFWIFLKAPNFDSVFAWRFQQEQKLRTKNSDSAAIMDEGQVLSFIQYYQRLTVHTLAVMDKKADCIFVLDNQRNIVQGTLHAKAINE
ncbi:hypothetical protein [Glaciecola sp. MF2-115]|uniref:hypothetical protein n=1 Tax=Glaciecola sp. MF2-115 TaxID=3384827 RepID=UPI00399F880A